MLVKIWKSMEASALKVEDTKIESDKNANLNNLKNIIAENKKTVEDFSSRIVPADGEVDLINGLEDLSKVTGALISVDSINEKDLVVAGVPTTLTDKMEQENIRLTAKGGWNQILKTWQLLENYPYQISIKQIDLESDTSQDTKSKTAWSLIVDLSLIKNK